MLKPYFDVKYKYEVGVDECARGPMFGRLYTAAVVLPNEYPSGELPKFDHTKMKDSKKIHSVKKMREISDYIQSHALAWHIGFVESHVIDEINIRQSVLSSMRESICNVLSKIEDVTSDNTFLLIDGNDFSKYNYSIEGEPTEIPHLTVEKGDNTYASIAAASILAKNAHDEYIFELCEKYPELKTRYDLHNNVGYGTKKHMDGIREHGICQWHRKSFGICKNADVNLCSGP